MKKTFLRLFLGLMTAAMLSATLAATPLVKIQNVQAISHGECDSLLGSAIRSQCREDEVTIEALDEEENVFCCVAEPYYLDNQIEEEASEGMEATTEGEGEEVVLAEWEPEWSLGRGQSGLEALGTILERALNIVFGVAVILALFYLIWGAISWITSSGDKTKTQTARQRIIAAVVGLILLAATWVILTIVLGVIYPNDGGGTGINRAIRTMFEN